MIARPDAMTRPEIDAVPSSTFPCSNKRAHNRGPGTRDRDNSPQSPSMSCATTSAGPRPHLLPPSYAHEGDKTTRHRGCSPGWLAHVLKRRASCTDASNVCMCVCVCARERAGETQGLPSVAHFLASCERALCSAHSHSLVVCLTKPAFWIIFHIPGTDYRCCTEECLARRRL